MMITMMMMTTTMMMMMMTINSLRPSDAYMRQQSYHHQFRQKRQAII